MISKAELARVRQMAEEFIRLTEHGGSDFETMNRYAQLSAALSVGSIALLDEIERLQRCTPAEPPRMVKMGSQSGSA